MDLDWCLTCSKHIDAPGTQYCSARCMPSPSRPVFSPLNADDWNDSEDDEEEAPIYHHIQDTSSLTKCTKGIAAWAANVPSGAPPSQISATPSSSSFQPKLLRPSSSSRRPVPPALSMSDSSLSSTPLATPPPSNRASVLSSLASHVKSFVRVPAMKPRINTVDNFHCHARSTSPSFDSAVEDDESPTDSSFEDTEDLWWVTESDTSSTSSMALKKSSAQSIIMEDRKDELVYFQPRVLPIELSSRICKAAELDEEDDDMRREQAYRSRGRQINRTAEDYW